MPGLKIPASNILLSLSILLAGGSATKVFKMFLHMGLGCVSLNTYFKYQRVSSKYTQVFMQRKFKDVMQLNFLFKSFTGFEKCNITT